MNFLKFLFLGLTLLSAQRLSASTVPSWVNFRGIAQWNAHLGGGVWFQEDVVIDNLGAQLDLYPKKVLVGLRGDSKEHGYRFDLDTRDTSWGPCEDIPISQIRYSHEKVMQTLENHNAEFIWCMPVPDTYSTNPYSPACSSQYGYPWQKPAYYAAYLEYLIRPATMTQQQLDALPVDNHLNYSFWQDASCIVPNSSVAGLLGNNWGNLRAKRGHYQPYNLLAVIFGIEPYGERQEHFIDNGARYAAIVRQFHDAFYARGGPLTTIPLGIQAFKDGAISDTSRGWFYPMMNALSGAPANIVPHFSYIDINHEYFMVDNTDPGHLNRIYPTLIHTGDGNPNHSPSWVYPYYEWSQSTWPTDYSAYLWTFSDIWVALNNGGYPTTPGRWHIGTAEHGMYLGGPTANDMNDGINAALWLAQMMRYNVEWDMNWVLCEQWFSPAQVQVDPGPPAIVTRTPVSYIYQLAQEFIGYNRYLSSYSTGVEETGQITNDQIAGYPAHWRSPDLEVRVFQEPGKGWYHLYAVNKNLSQTLNITGWETWVPQTWRIIKANSYTDRNVKGQPETVNIQWKTVVQATNQVLAVPPCSVSHITLADYNLVSVSVSRPAISESATTAGYFRISRAAATPNPCTVYFLLSGTATPAPTSGPPTSSTDYFFTGDNYSGNCYYVATIPANATFIDVPIIPRYDSVHEGDETIIVTLRDMAWYDVQAGSSSTTVTILDDDP